MAHKTAVAVKQTAVAVKQQHQQQTGLLACGMQQQDLQQHAAVLVGGVAGSELNSGWCREGRSGLGRVSQVSQARRAWQSQVGLVWKSKGRNGGKVQA